MDTTLTIDLDPVVVTLYSIQISVYILDLENMDFKRLSGAIANVFHIGEVNGRTKFSIFHSKPFLFRQIKLTIKSAPFTYTTKSFF